MTIPRQHERQQPTLDTHPAAGRTTAPRTSLSPGQTLAGSPPGNLRDARRRSR
jgi:hypothetical protein